MAGTTPQQQSIGELVSSAVSDVSTLVSDQIELTKTELRASAQNAGRAFGLLAGAAFVAFLFTVFLLVTIAYVLVAVGLPTWAGFGIVAAVLLIITIILALVGRSRAKRVQGPQAAIAELESTRRALAPGAPDTSGSGN